MFMVCLWEMRAGARVALRGCGSDFCGTGEQCRLRLGNGVRKGFPLTDQLLLSSLPPTPLSTLTKTKICLFSAKEFDLLFYRTLR